MLRKRVSAPLFVWPVLGLLRTTTIITTFHPANTPNCCLCHRPFARTPAVQTAPAHLPLPSVTPIPNARQVPGLNACVRTACCMHKLHCARDPWHLT